MKREEARVLARSLMDAAGLTDWRFRFDHAKRRAGACTHTVAEPNMADRVESTSWMKTSPTSAASHWSNTSHRKRP